jgi:hypothetical protein
MTTAITINVSEPLERVQAYIDRRNLWEEFDEIDEAGGVPLTLSDLKDTATELDSALDLLARIDTVLGLPIPEHRKVLKIARMMGNPAQKGLTDE